MDFDWYDFVLDLLAQECNNEVEQIGIPFFSLEKMMENIVKADK